jgi:hypothetical protein
VELGRGVLCGTPWADPWCGWGGLLPTVPVNQSPPGSDAYEEVTDGAQTGGLGKSEQDRWDYSFGWTPGTWYLGLGLEVQVLGVQWVWLWKTKRTLRRGNGLCKLPTSSCLSFSIWPHSTLPLLGFNLRIGRPKGPRDPPAEWTRVWLLQLCLPVVAHGCLDCCYHHSAGVMCWEWKRWIWIKIKVSQAGKSGDLQWL